MTNRIVLLLFLGLGLFPLLQGQNQEEAIPGRSIVIDTIVSINSNKEDYNIGLGVEDENFLGRNIRFKIRAGLNSTGNDWDFRFLIPRQLLY